MKKENQKNNFIDELSKTLSEKRLKRAYNEAEKEILYIRLAEIREKRGFKQEDIHSFSQSSVSKLEKRKDMKISTLIEYLDDLGLALEIKAYPKSKHTKKDEFILLKGCG
ncbi:MAG: XRE family transcriptional regulator [Bacteroidota bacterium]